MVLSVLTVLVVLFSGAGLANAAPAAGITSLTIASGGTSGNTVTLSLTFTTPATENQVEDAVTQLGGDPSTVSISGPAATAGAASLGAASAQSGPSPGQRLPCGSGNTWADSQGLFSLQHNCGQTTVQWSWRMNSNLQPSVVGTLSERGMDWWRNDAKQPRQSPHPFVARNYTFHGTFSGSPTGTRLSYHDEIAYRHNIAGGGNALVTIGGTFSYYQR